jgi:hypothetical protein
MEISFEDNELDQQKNVILEVNDSDKTSIEIQFDELLKSLSNIKPQITLIQNQIKNVEKNVNKEIKILKKLI